MALSRRSFLKRAAGAAGALAVAPLVTPAAPAEPSPAPLETPRPVSYTTTIDLTEEHDRIFREAAVSDPALLMALVRHSLISRDSAVKLFFKEG